MTDSAGDLSKKRRRGGRGRTPAKRRKAHRPPRRAGFADLPEDVVRDICAILGRPNLVAIVRLAATCRTLRAHIGAIAPWRGTLEALVAPPVPDGTESPAPPRSHRHVAPADLAGRKEWYRPLAKYGPRLCLGCGEMPGRLDVLRVDVPAVLLDLVEWEIEDMDAFVGIWEDPTCPQEVPTARSSLCRDCRQFLWKIALHLARGRVDGVPDCAAQLAEVRQHARINKGDAEDSYFLRGRLNGLQYDRCVVAKRKIWGGGYFEIVAHRYREREVLVRAWRVHGGPWGLEAVWERAEERARKRKAERGKRARVAAQRENKRFWSEALAEEALDEAEAAM